MKITFLGTGGGRFAMIYQLRSTGGFIIESENLKMCVDPGPGTLVKANQYKRDLTKIDLLFVSHGHVDHRTDTEVVIEAMTAGVKKKKGILISNKECIKGTDDVTPIASRYHLDSLEKVYIVGYDKEIEVAGTTIKTTKCNHGERECMGFVFEDEKRIGYTSDGEYYEGQEEYFKNCDCLIINCLRPRGENYYTHMVASTAKILIDRAKPKIAILTHLGVKMLFGVAEREAAWIQKETGIKTLAARDGQTIELKNEKSLKEF